MSWLRAFRNPRVIAILILAVVGISVLGSGAALFATLQSERAARHQVELTHEILGRLRAVLVAVIDAETGQRGYLLTHDRSYLVPFRNGSNALPQAVSALNEILLPIAVPDQVAKLNALSALAASKLTELSRVIGLVDAGRNEEALAVVVQGEGQRLMRSLRATLTDLEDEEERILSASIRRAESTEKQSIQIVSVLAGGVLLLLAYGLWAFGRATRLDEAMRSVETLKEARDRADMLTRELNHRVKNLFAVVASIVSLTARGETDVRVAADKVRDRIQALATAHSVSQGQSMGPWVALRALVDAVLAPYSMDPARKTIHGDDVVLPESAATPLGLTLHELATNAVKHGAWSGDGGSVRIEWSTRRDDKGADAVTLTWTEIMEESPQEASEPGFGTRMMQQAARQLGGTIEREFRSNGVHVTLAFTC